MTIFRGKGNKGDSDRAKEVAGSVGLLSPASSGCAYIVSAPDAMDSVPFLPYPRYPIEAYTKTAFVKAKDSPWLGFEKSL